MEDMKDCEDSNLEVIAAYALGAQDEQLQRLVNSLKKKEKKEEEMEDGE
jgi:hypothetical protein